MKFNQRHKIRRELLGLSQKDIAEALKLSVATISAYELDKLDNMSEFVINGIKYYPPCSYHPCSLCNHNYRRRGKHRKYGKDIFCDLTNEYVGCRSAEVLGCENFISIYDEENNNGNKNN